MEMKEEKMKDGRKGGRRRRVADWHSGEDRKDGRRGD